MQQHPVPQNIIGFQFKLVGDMTLKQFGYLAGGIILAIVASKLPYPAIFNYTLAGSIAFFGFALAFLPIEDRPLDVWLKNFFRSIFSPTQFIYQKTGGSLAFLDIDLTRNTANTALIIEKNLKQDKYREYLGTLSQPQKNDLDSTINQYIGSLNLSSNIALQSLNVSAPPPLSSTIITPPVKNQISAPTRRTYDSHFQSINLSSLTEDAKTKIVHDSYVAPKAKIQPNANFDYLIKNVQNSKLKTDMNAEDQKKKEFVEIKLREILKKDEPVDSQSKQSASCEPEEKTIDVSKLKKLYQTPQTPRTPNIISGTIADCNDEPIRGAIVEIKNSFGSAVRTLKTNNIGQFAAATPLPNGTYTIHIDAENLCFDIIKILLDNKIVEPILIKEK